MSQEFEIIGGARLQRVLDYIEKNPHGIQRALRQAVKRTNNEIRARTDRLTSKALGSTLKVTREASKITVRVQVSGAQVIGRVKVHRADGIPYRYFRNRQLHRGRYKTTKNRRRTGIKTIFGRGNQSIKPHAFFATIKGRFDGGVFKRTTKNSLPIRQERTKSPFILLKDAGMDKDLRVYMQDRLRKNVRSSIAWAIRKAREQ